MLLNGISSVGHNQGANQAGLPRVKLPPLILTRTEPKMSDEEFEQRIREMAKRDQAAGRFQSNDANSEFHSLNRSFVSVVSPDREGMISNALPTILRNIRAHTNTTPLYSSHEEMIMHLLFGKEPPSSPNLKMGQNITLFELKDANGNLLARLSTSGWEMHSTSAENARHAEFIAIYNDAWDLARHIERYGCPESRRECGWGESASNPVEGGTLSSHVPVEFDLESAVLKATSGSAVIQKLNAISKG